MKFNNETLRIAVKEWLKDETTAEAKYSHISNWNTSQVTDMSKLFLDAHTFNEPLNNWDVSQVTNMHAMFDNAYVFNQPLNNWDVSKVTNMSEMFSMDETLDLPKIIYWLEKYDEADMYDTPEEAWYALDKFQQRQKNVYGSFNQPIGTWNVSNVTNMSAMFNNAYVFNQPIGNWDVSSVNDMSYMFAGATAFNQPIGNWDVSKVTDMVMMFCNTTAFNQPIGNWDVSSVIDMKTMFAGGIFNQPIGDWDVSKVTTMNNMFNTATAFNQPIGNWDVSSVRDMSNMFAGATAFNQPIGDWDVSSVRFMNNMFNTATAFNQPIGNWDVSEVRYMYSMFFKATAFIQPIGNWEDVSQFLCSVNNTEIYDTVEEAMFNNTKETIWRAEKQELKKVTAKEFKLLLIISGKQGEQGYSTFTSDLVTSKETAKVLASLLYKNLIYIVDESPTGWLLTYYAIDLIGFPNSFMSTDIDIAYRNAYTEDY